MEQREESMVRTVGWAMAPGTTPRPVRMRAARLRMVLTAHAAQPRPTIRALELTLLLDKVLVCMGVGDPHRFKEETIGPTRSDLLTVLGTRLASHVVMRVE